MKLLVGWGVPEEDGVVMRAVELIAVLAALEEADFLWGDFFTEPFHEFLKVFRDQRVADWQVVIVVGECRERGQVREVFHFVMAANGKGLASVKSAADALAAGDGHFLAV